MAGVRFFSVYQGFGGNEEYNGGGPKLFGDGTQTRDFTHVDDIARACELADDHELTGVYNVVTEESYSFNKMVEMINDALGTDIDPVCIECPFDGHVHDKLAAISKFHDKTG